RSSLRCGARSSGARRQLVEHRSDGVADGVDLVELVLGNGDVEALLDCHDQLDDVEAVGVEIGKEPGPFGDLSGVDAEDLDTELLQGGEDVVSFHRAPFRWCGWLATHAQAAVD